MKNKVFAAALAFLLIIALTACSGNSGSVAPEPAPEPPSAPPQAKAQTPPPDEILVLEDEPVALEAAAPSDLVVHFLDVGQADSILIELPNRQVMLIDGGNAGDETKIMSYMKTLDITAIDYLVATHPHADHIGGLPAIIDKTDVGEIYIPRASHTTRTFERLISSIERKGLQLNVANAGVNILSASDLQIDILAPVKDSYDNLNNYSAVIKIVYGDTGFLFMGDAEALSEGQITSDVSADVIKVGHHGSKSSTSKAFLGKAAPSYGIITVGENSYGHPTDEILKRLDDANVKVFRTDLQGTIVFTSDGESITADTEPAPYKAAAAAAAADLPKPADPKNDSVMVWLSATGSKYHRINNCGTMNPDKARQVTLESVRNSYEPCGKCNPPR